MWSRDERRWVPFGAVPRRWWAEAALAAGFAAVTVLLLWPSWLVDVDVAVRDFCLGHHATPLFWTARVLTFAGQGLPLSLICLGLAAWLSRRHRTIRPLLPVAAAYVVLALVLGVKDWMDRVPPRFPTGHAPYVDAAGSVLFSGQGASSYPSGHGANTAVWYGLIVLLCGAALSATWRRVLLVAPPLVSLSAQLYLGYHWLSDSVAGYLLGWLIIRAVRRVPWDRVGLSARFGRGGGRRGRGAVD